MGKIKKNKGKRLVKVFNIRSMDCWHCGTNLIWGGDHDVDDEESDFLIVSNLTCPNCGTYVEVYYPKEPTSHQVMN
jgi:hypothetical protein|tara:strand:+ start:361 stop:588 length:228 start_codon:yes stop_codon:yes gene_type:complete